ncbi:MAG: membrane dipeptidase [Pseudomonadota bacterium]
MDLGAADFLQDTLVWDNHACMPLRPGDPTFLPQLYDVHQAGVDVVSLNIGFGPGTLEDHVRVLASFRRWVRQQGDPFVLPRSVDDIDRANAAGQLSIIFDIEGLSPFDQGDFGLLEMFADLGVKWALFAYNRNNEAGGGCMDDDPGLSPHGLSLLREMERVGIVPCCSHTGHRTARDVLKTARGPVIFSHSNASAVFAHDRNIPDDLAKACAETGGVVGINGLGPFLGSDDLADAMARHIDHFVQLIGPQHVGVSLDYVFDQHELEEYLRTMPDIFPNEDALQSALNLAPPSTIAPLTEKLRTIGYTDDMLASILGGNWRRVAIDCWKS